MAKPTVMNFGTPPVKMAEPQAASPLAELLVKNPPAPLPVVPPKAATPLYTGSIVLTEEQAAKAQQMLDTFDFATMAPEDVIKLGFEAEQGLHKTLDGFLAALDPKTAEATFAVFDRLVKGVKDADLGSIQDKLIKGDKPSGFARFTGSFRGKSAEDLARDALAEVRDLLSGKTRTLDAEMKVLERQLADALVKLTGELKMISQLKVTYGAHREDFAVAAAVGQALSAIAQEYVEAETAKAAAAPDALAQARLQELQGKLQMVQSRALSLEGTYTGLPADQMVLQQIEYAGVSTLQETATSANERFARIKMGLIKLYGAVAVKGVQQMSGRLQSLDRSLATIGTAVLKDAVSTAATAAGDNRLEMANQIGETIKNTQELDAIVSAGRKTNEENFGKTSAMLQDFRKALAKQS